MLNGMGKRYRQAKELSSAVPVHLATGIALAEIARRVFDRKAVSSYAQAGEDRIIEQILYQVSGHCAPRFYVDVGANDPIAKSNTFRLYLRGWRGVAIDGNEAFAARYRRCRPRDRWVCAVVSREVEDVLFEVNSDSALSRIVRPGEGTQGDDAVERHWETTTRLEEIFEKNGVPRQFGLLNIDVEGSDYDALCSFDIEKYRPALIVIEMHGFDIAAACANSVFRYLCGSGYKMVAYAGRNGFFVDDMRQETNGVVGSEAGEVAWP